MKVVFLGDSAVGKTCIINSILGNSFGNNNPTINANSSDIDIKLENKVVKLSIWDTAGQEAYQSLAPIYAQGSKAQILVFAVNNDLSFSNLSGWHDFVGDSLSNVFVVGNKIDLPEEERQVTFDEGMEYAQSINASYCEVSAKTGSGITELFNLVAQHISQDNKADPNPPVININPEPKANDDENTDKTKKKFKLC